MMCISKKEYLVLSERIKRRVEENYGDFSGFGTVYHVRIILNNLWCSGRQEDAVNILIVYHFTRHKDLVIQFREGISYRFKRKISIQNLAEKLGIELPEPSIEVLTLEEFKETCNGVYESIPYLGKRGPERRERIERWLSVELGGNKYRCWTTEVQHEITVFRRLFNITQVDLFVKLLVLYRYTALSDVRIGDRVWFKQGSSLGEILTKLEEVVE